VIARGEARRVDGEVLVRMAGLHRTGGGARLGPFFFGFWRKCGFLGGDWGF
jgi:hypothetical protein